jgi:aldose 1-epimerase
MLWGSYPMAPWAGRVRHGRFRFDGIEHRLPIDAPPHAIHGTAHLDRWDVVDAGRDHCELQCDLRWQFGGIAHQHLVLRPDGLVMLLAVAATTQRMPAVLGWHPCFHPPDAARLHFGAMYRRDDEGIPSGELVPPPPSPWDDCFVRPQQALTMRYGSPVDGLEVRLDSDCDHWVVFDELPDALCVEPQSGPPDAFNLGTAAVLEPGELLQRRFEIAWQRPPTGR